jgi:hypothetical protein
MTRKELTRSIVNMESELKHKINERAQALLDNTEVLESLKYQLNDWKELVNPVTRGTKLDRLEDLQRAHTVALNIMKQVEWHLTLLEGKQ